MPDINKKISLICAKPSPNNPGMMSVDLAFDFFYKRNKLPFQISRYYFVQGPQSISYSQNYTLEYSDIKGNLEEIYHSDLIVFWGDFLHAWNYHYHTILHFFLKSTLHNKAALSEIRKHLLLSEAPDSILKKTISCGTTLIGDDEVVLTSHIEHRNAVSKFFRTAAGVWMRDPYSALQVAYYRSDYTESCLGIDCSMFIHPRDMNIFINQNYDDCNSKNGCISVHFGRSQIDHTPFFIFVETLSQRINKKTRWIPWLNNDEKYIRQALSFIPSMKVLQTSDYGSFISEISKSSFVITDTYHMAVISWRMGVPAICIGLGAQHPQYTTDDKKKEIFYYMYNAKPFYIYAEKLADKLSIESIANSIIPLILNKNISKAISDKMSQHAESIERQLVSLSNKILNLQ